MAKKYINFFIVIALFSANIFLTVKVFKLRKLKKFAPLFYNDTIKSDRNGVFHYHGQYYEDVILHGMTRTFLNKLPKDVKYLEIGVWDPIQINNTYYFYKNGATGYLADPLPLAKENSTKYRPRDKFFPFAIVGGKSDMDMNFISNGDISSIDDERKSDGQKITVKTLNINDLISQINEEIDIFEIDIEGYEENVFSAIDFKKFKPKIILCEWPTEKIYKILKLNNYIPYFVSGYELHNPGQNFFFIRREIFDKYINQDFKVPKYDPQKVRIDVFNSSENLTVKVTN